MVRITESTWPRRLGYPASLLIDQAPLELIPFLNPLMRTWIGVSTACTVTASVEAAGSSSESVDIPTCPLNTTDVLTIAIRSSRQCSLLWAKSNTNSRRCHICVSLI